MASHLKILSLSIVAVLCNACFLWTAKEDGETLKQNVQHLDDRLSRIEEDLSEERQHLSEMIEKARGEVESLEETLTKATRILSRNSADFGAEIESIKNRLNATDGAFAEINHELKELDDKMESSNRKVIEFAAAAGLDLPVDESTVPAKQSDHFNAIKNSLAQDRFGEVRSLAKEFLKKYPNSKNADDVQLLIAKAYLEQRRWAKALGVLRLFTDKYPKSNLSAEVLYEMAHAFFELGDCTDARILIEALTTRYKKSYFSKKATILLKTINQKKSRCTS